MDKKIANNITVGLFTLVGVGAFLFMLFTIGGGKGIFSSEYTLYARFAQVKGLNYGSEVSLAGLRAGTVKRITVENKENTKDLLIEMAIGTDMKDKIRGDTQAAILTSGVLGDKYIELSIGSPGTPELKDGDTVPSKQEPDLFSKSGKLIEDINRQFEKGNNIDVLLKRLNNIASNVNSLTEDLETSDKGLWHEMVRGQSAQNINNATSHLNSILKKIDTGEGSLGALINDPTVYEDIKSLMGGAKRSTILKYFMRSFIDSGSQPKDKDKDKDKKGE